MNHSVDRERSAAKNAFDLLGTWSVEVVLVLGLVMGAIQFVELVFGIVNSEIVKMPRKMLRMGMVMTKSK